MQFAAVCVWIQTSVTPATVSSCAGDIDTTACLNGLKADVSLSSLDHSKSSVIYGSNEEAGISRVIEICPQVYPVWFVYNLLYTGWIFKLSWLS